MLVVSAVQCWWCLRWWFLGSLGGVWCVRGRKKAIGSVSLAAVGAGGVVARLAVVNKFEFRGWLTD